MVFSKMYRRSIVVFNQQENQVQEQIFYSPEDEAAGIRPEELVHPVSGLRQGGRGVACVRGGRGVACVRGGGEWPASGGEGIWCTLCVSLFTFVISLLFYFLDIFGVFGW